MKGPVSAAGLENQDLFSDFGTSPVCPRMERCTFGDLFFAEAVAVLVHDPGPGSPDAPGEEGALAAPADRVSGPPTRKESPRQELGHRLFKDDLS